MKNCTIMYHNIWGWNESETNPTPLRNRYLFDSYLTYRPEILCLQEVTRMMRFNGEFPIIAKLCENGYAEAEVEPYKEKYYTATPILYRTDVFKLTDKGVYKFGTVEGAPDEGSGGADKFITWAVLERIESGELLGVVSVHLAYQRGEEGEAFRLSQVPLVLETAKNIAEKYSCPVIVGGDMNCNQLSKPYAAYLEGGLSDVFDYFPKDGEGRNPNCDDYTSHYGYPVFNTEKGVFERHQTIPARKYWEAIDHIFYLGDKLNFHYFKIVTDTDALLGSDHAPLLIEVDV